MSQVEGLYGKLESCIVDFSLERYPGDYWYDCGILEAADVLREFDKGDWELLLDDLKDKGVFWRKRLVECLGDFKVLYEIEVILRIVNTDDEDLRICCFDALRMLDLSGVDGRTREELSSRAEYLLDEVSLPVKKILEDFVERLNG
ncbi:hypothetical protein [Metapseudomonas otitidis]|uniref:hypothetical protein n=1 Tax=Metapseudomonas otitidis TaxID=319939 RepID=UPI003CFAE78A